MSESDDVVAFSDTLLRHYTIIFGTLKVLW